MRQTLEKAGKWELAEKLLGKNAHDEFHQIVKHALIADDGPFENTRLFVSDYL